MLLCQMRDINSGVGGKALAQNKRNSLPCTVRTSRQRSCNQRVSCLLYSMARINDPWNVSLEKRKYNNIPQMYAYIRIICETSKEY